MNHLTLIYDGECEFCRRWMDWIRKQDLHQKITFIPCQSEERKKLFPQISEEKCLNAMHVVLPTGQIFAGADAIPRILYILPGWTWSVTLFRIPGVLLIARPVYRLIARKRHGLSCNF